MILCCRKLFEFFLPSIEILNASQMNQPKLKSYFMYFHFQRNKLRLSFTVVKILLWKWNHEIFRWKSRTIDRSYNMGNEYLDMIIIWMKDIHSSHSQFQSQEHCHHNFYSPTSLFCRLELRTDAYRKWFNADFPLVYLLSFGDCKMFIFLVDVHLVCLIEHGRLQNSNRRFNLMNDIHVNAFHR